MKRTRNRRMRKNKTRHRRQKLRKGGCAKLSDTYDGHKYTYNPELSNGKDKCIYDGPDTISHRNVKYTLNGNKNGKPTFVVYTHD